MEADGYFYGDISDHAGKFQGGWPLTGEGMMCPMVIDLGGNTVSTDKTMTPYYQCGWINSGKFDLVVRNGRLSGFTRGDQAGNYCGVFVGDPQGHQVNVTVQDVQIDGCDDGIRGGSPGVAVTLTRVMFTGCGLGVYGLTHNCYVAHADSVTATDCVSTNVTGGHLFKSRAAVTTIEGCTFGDGPDGTSSYVLDCPNGGVVTVSNSTLAHGPKSVTGRIMCVGEEDTDPNNEGSGPPWPSSTVTLNNVTLVGLNPGVDGGQVGLWNALTVPLTATGVSAYGQDAGTMRGQAGVNGSDGSLSQLPAVVELATCANLSFASPVQPMT